MNEISGRELWEGGRFENPTGDFDMLSVVFRLRRCLPAVHFNSRISAAIYTLVLRELWYLNAY